MFKKILLLVSCITFLSIFYLSNNYLTNYHSSFSTIEISKDTEYSNSEFLSSIDIYTQEEQADTYFKVVSTDSTTYFSTFIEEPRIGIRSKDTIYKPLSEASNIYFGDNAIFYTTLSQQEISSLTDNPAISNVNTISSGNTSNFFFENFGTFMLFISVSVALLFGILFKHLEFKKNHKILFLHGFSSFNTQSLLLKRILQTQKHGILFICLLPFIIIIFWEANPLYLLFLTVLSFVIFLSITCSFHFVSYYLIKINPDSLYVVKIIATLILPFLIVFSFLQIQNLYSLGLDILKYSKIESYYAFPINLNTSSPDTYQEIENVGNHFRNFYNQTVDTYNGIAIKSENKDTSSTCVDDSVDPSCHIVYINPNALELEEIIDENGYPLSRESLDPDKVDVLLPSNYTSIYSKDKLEEYSPYFSASSIQKGFNFIWIENNQNFTLYDTYQTGNNMSAVKNPILMVFEEDEVSDSFFYGLIGNYNGNYFIDMDEHSKDDIKTIMEESGIDKYVSDSVQKTSMLNTSLIETFQHVTVLLSSTILIFITIVMVIYDTIRNYLILNQRAVYIKMIHGYSYRQIFENLLYKYLLTSLLVLGLMFIVHFFFSFNFLIYLLIYLLLEMVSLIIAYTYIKKQKLASMLKGGEYD